MPALYFKKNIQTQAMPHILRKDDERVSDDESVKVGPRTWYFILRLERGSEVVVFYSMR